jgi:general secretion pathway protein E
VLVNIAPVPGVELAEQVISRIKVMSELDIAERRVPQDGRFKIVFESRPIDFRVSIIPSIFGEDAVLRVLDKKALTQMSGLRLDVLGFDHGIMTELRKLSSLPYGMLLVTGPTGSGKTTTLYGAISETQTGRDKIVTIEDPVEYQLPGVLQIPVNEKKGLTFARGLRSILRHDRTRSWWARSATGNRQIAIQSALTGHLVFTTVPPTTSLTSSAVSSTWGGHLQFVSALSGVLAQRLVPRHLCTVPSGAPPPSLKQLEDSGVSLAVRLLPLPQRAGLPPALPRHQATAAARPSANCWSSATRYAKPSSTGAGASAEGSSHSRPACACCAPPRWTWCVRGRPRSKGVNRVTVMA